MAETFGPFDGVSWTQAQWFDFASAWAPSGVVGVPVASTTTGELPLTVNGLTVSLGTGRAGVRGAGYKNDAAKAFTVTANANASLSRMDRIVLRRDLAAKTVTAIRLQGTAAATPVAPALTQSDAGQWDLPLFSFLVPPNSGTTLTGIGDERVWVDPSGSGRLLVSTMANRPTVGVATGDRLSPLDRPALIYVWDGTRWVMENLNTNVLSTAPAGSYVTKVEGTAVVTTAAGGAVSVPTGWTFSAGPLWVSLAVGDSAGGVGIAQAVGAGTTGTNIAGAVYAPNGTALGAGANVRLTFTVVGYNT